MRIAYVSLHWPRTKNSGVGKKIQSQISIWNANGHPARLFMHTTPYQPLSDLIEADCFFYQPEGKLRSEFSRMDAMSQMLISLRNFQPDVIYLRDGMYVFPAHQLADIAPVIEEINTNDLTQHEELGKIYSLYNRLTRGFFLRRVHGLVTVSHELAVSSAFTSFKKNTCVIANGIELNRFPLLPPTVNKIPRLVFMGTPNTLWHGVDKLVLLANLIPDIYIDLIGYEQIAPYQALPKNIKLYGYLNFEQYQNVLAQADVAISSLGLHRIQLDEASPLKSRECLAFGLPLIMAYQDTDLLDSDYDFLLKIPNKEDNIQTHAHAIRDFAYRMQGRRVQKDQIKNLDQSVKEKKRIQFFEEILQSK